MAVASVTAKPQIISLGAGREERQSFTAGGVDTIYAGDLIRINDAGTIDVAEAASAGAVHGMALEANAATATIIPIVLFAPDTLIKIQCIDTKAPEDLTKGLVYTLETSTANKQAITATTTNGVGLVTAYAGDSIPWTSAVTSFDETDSTNNNSVVVRILASVLDGNAAAAT